MVHAASFLWESGGSTIGFCVWSTPHPTVHILKVHQSVMAPPVSSHSQVALLDIDICGPSIPKIMGLEGEQVN